MAQRKVTAFVDSQERLTEDVYSMWIREEEMAAQAKPGQFISVYTKDGAKLLPRPISICETNKETGMLRIVYDRRSGNGGVLPLPGGRYGRYHGTSRQRIPAGGSSRGKDCLLNRGRNRDSSHAGAGKAVKLQKEVILGYRDVLFLNEELPLTGKWFLRQRTEAPEQRAMSLMPSESTV